MNPRHLLILCLVAAAALFLAGCDDDATGPEAGTGTLHLTLVDAPVDFDDVTLDVRATSVHRADDDSLSGWHVVSTDSAVVHLLDLTNGVSALLADADLPAGNYDQIRMRLGDGNTVTVGDDTFDLRVPSGPRSGLKIHHEFEIVEGETYDAVIDIDVSRSVHRTGHGSYMMRPVVRMQHNAVCGRIAGVVNPIAAEAMVWTVAGADTVQTFADPLTGGFMLVALPEGAYDVIITPTAGDWLEKTLTDVEVVARTTNDVGTIDLDLP
jgi:hypothetical protein